jgi:echinoderm microtubule-associated protein-like 6
VWDCNKHNIIKVIPLDVDIKGNKLPKDKNTKELSHSSQGRSVDISMKDDLCAVGMRDGSVRLYKTSSWTCIAIKRVTNKWIEDLKFSPDGKYLAVGSHDTDVHILTATPQLELFYKANKSSGAITHVDWSEDSSNIRTNDNAYELLFYNVSGKSHMPGGASATNNEPWNTASCVLTWATQGIWEGNQDGSDINHCDRSRQPIVDDMQLIATANDSGQVNVFRYPCSKEGAKAVVGTGHSSHVTKVRFTRTCQSLISTGGNDTAVMQWRIN